MHAPHVQVVARNERAGSVASIQFVLLLLGFRKETAEAFNTETGLAVLATGLFASLVLLTLAKPTMLCVIPPTVPVKVGLLIGAFSASLPFNFWIASNILSVAVMVPAADE